MVIISNISIHSLCPHHLVPFEGIAHVAYVPGGRLHGFGRIARLIDVISHRLTYQEWICQEVADALVQYGMAKGAACVIQAKQMCLQLGENRRGAEAVITQGFAGAISEAPQPLPQRVQAGHASLSVLRTCSKSATLRRYGVETKLKMLMYHVYIPLFTRFRLVSPLLARL